MEGGRPPWGHAAARHSPDCHATPTRLAPSSATPRHHQEEQEEMFLVPLSAGGGSKRLSDAVKHRIPFLEKLQMINYDEDLMKNNKKTEWDMMEN